MKLKSKMLSDGGPNDTKGGHLLGRIFTKPVKLPRAPKIMGLKVIANCYWTV